MMANLDSNYGFVRCSSHRSREKLERLLGLERGGLHGYYPSFSSRGTSHIYPVPKEKMDEACSISGVSKAQWRKGYLPTYVEGLQTF